jgi:hypothetical protein
MDPVDFVRPTNAATLAQRFGLAAGHLSCVLPFVGSFSTNNLGFLRLNFVARQPSAPRAAALSGNVRGLFLAFLRIF